MTRLALTATLAGWTGALHPADPGPAVLQEGGTTGDVQEEDDAAALLSDDGLDALLSGILLEDEGSLGPPSEMGVTGDAAADGFDPLDGLLGTGAHASGPASKFRSLEGYVGFRPRVYTAGSPPGEDSQVILEGELELEWDLARRTSAYVRPRYRIDLSNPEVDRFEPFEAYVTHSGADWDLRLGQFVENWGIVDTFNPIDVINRRDFASDFLDADRLGELGARWRRHFEGGDTLGEPTLSLYLLPVFRRTRFPSMSSRFSLGTAALPFDEDAGGTPHGRERLLYAGRAQGTLNTAPFNADLQFLLAHGPERLPLVQPSGGRLAPFYFGTTTLGGGLRAVPNVDSLGSFLASLTLKAEVAHKRAFRFDDSPIQTPDDYLQYVLGIDRLFPNLVIDGDQLTLTVEFAGESGADDAASFLRPFQSDLVLRAFWERNDFARTSLEARAILDTQMKERIYEVIFEQQLRALHEDLALTLHLQVFDTDDRAGVFSMLPDNTSLGAGLRFDF